MDRPRARRKKKSLGGPPKGRTPYSKIAEDIFQLALRGVRGRVCQTHDIALFQQTLPLSGLPPLRALRMMLPTTSREKVSCAKNPAGFWPLFLRLLTAMPKTLTNGCTASRSSRNACRVGSEQEVGRRPHSREPPGHVQQPLSRSGARGRSEASGRERTRRSAPAPLREVEESPVIAASA